MLENDMKKSIVDGLSDEQLKSLGTFVSNLMKQKQDNAPVFNSNFRTTIRDTAKDALRNYGKEARDVICEYGMAIGEDVAFELFSLCGLFEDMGCDAASFDPNKYASAKEMSINMIMNTAIAVAGMVLFIAKSILDGPDYTSTVNGLFEAMDKLPDAVDVSFSSSAVSLEKKLVDLLENDK